MPNAVTFRTLTARIRTHNRISSYRHGRWEIPFYHCGFLAVLLVNPYWKWNSRRSPS